MERQSQRLSTAWPRMTAEGSRRTQASLGEGCYCGSETATLKRRKVSGAVTVWLQCDGCGRGYNNAQKRAEHYGWQDYPEWDDEAQDRYQETRRQRFHESLAASREDHSAAMAKRRAEYEAWCRSSPEWLAIRQKVLWRCRRICEACLQAEAIFIHHLTYESGKLPPAWHLRGVCQDCHDRLHTGGDDWCLPWMVR